MDQTQMQFDRTRFERLSTNVSHFVNRLKETPLLLGWLLVGPLVALYIDGWIGLGLGLINIILIGGYAALIRWMTPASLAPEPVKRPRLELMLALGLFGLLMLIQLLDFDVWTAQPWYGWVKESMTRVYLGVESLKGIPAWAQRDVYIAVSSTIKQLIPTLLAFGLLGYWRSGIRLVRPYWKLSAALVGITTFFGFVTGFLASTPLNQVLALYLIGIFINALPEELFFRGFLLPRLEKVFANPLNALVVSALLFNALHIPIVIHNGASPVEAILGMFSIGYPSGLIWGYLYLRTRSIIPGMLWHASNGLLGLMLMSQ